MQRRLIVANLAPRGQSSREIHVYLEVILRLDAEVYCSVPRYLREIQFPPSYADAASVDVPRGGDHFD
jgi:hypothetical protein